MNRTKKLFLLLFCAVFSTAAFAQTTAVKGKLLSASDNEGLPFATVAVASESSPENVIRRFATGTDGTFSTELEFGTYIFTFHFVGMNELRKTVEVTESPNPLDLGEIALFESSEELGEVSVMAMRPLVRVDIDRLVYSVQDDPESATSNVLDILRNVPLVTVDGEDNIQLRGSTNFVIYLNGRPSNMITNNPSQVLRAMPANSIRNIEVITEPGARYSAEGIGGIINIVTDQRVDDGYTGSVGGRVDNLGSFGTNAFLTVRRGRFGFTGNFWQNLHRQPESSFEQVREDFAPFPDNVFTTTGLQHGQRGKMFGGSAMLTFEPDTLNLFTVSFNSFSGRWFSDAEGRFVSSGARDFEYEMHTNMENMWGNMSLSADYQRNFRRQGEKLTISYRWQQTPNESFSLFSIPFVYGDVPPPFALDYEQRSRNIARGHEHTGQIDYVNPLSERHIIEAGLKYIFRHNFSEGFSKYLFDENADIWHPVPARSTDLDHRQQISAAYASYTFRLEGFSLRAGVRAEHTSQTIVNTDTTFSNRFFDPVPNIAVSYQLRPTTTLRAGYNKRIQRPGIWLLNPFRDDANPTEIRYGNPDLTSENIHNFSLGFGHFARQFSINATLSYNFTNNAILWHRFVEDGIVHHTVGNIGRRQGADLSVFGSWTPIPQLRMNLNGGVNYVELQGTGELESVSGFRGRVSTNITYTLPLDFRLGFNGGIFPAPVQLQTTGSGWHFYAFSLSRSFLNRRLDVAVRANNPFERTRTWTSETTGNGFTQNLTAGFPMRSFGFSINYRFGELRTQVRRVERTITTDDVIGGQQQGGGGQGGQQGGGM